MLGITKTPLSNRKVGQPGFEGLLWGPSDLWARPICPWGIQRSKPRRAMAQADKIKHKKSLGYIQGQFGPRQNLKSHRREWQKGYRTKFERKSDRKSVV